MIISLVRSNPEKYVGELLQDWRRVNVAFTRAKSKLVVFGSRSTIRETSPLDEFVKLVEGRGWVYEVPSDAVRPASPSKSLRKSPRKSPRKMAVAKENLPPIGQGRVAKTMKVTGATVLKGRPLLRDIVNEHR